MLGKVHHFVSRPDVKKLDQKDGNTDEKQDQFETRIQSDIQSWEERQERFSMW